MKPAAFDYVRPVDLQEALDALAQFGARARVLAGGQSLLALLNIRLADPDVLVDISRLGELQQIRIDGDWVEIGAAVVQADLLAWPQLAAELPLLAQALPWVGHFQTRNRGTVCGSIAHSDPSSELPLCLATLGGEVELRSARGVRRLDAAAFQTGMLTTARAPDEVLTAVRFPRARPGEGYAFDEVARRHGDFAIVAFAARATANGTLLGVGGVADRPTVRDLGHAGGTALDDALNAFAWSLGGHDDVHATARYRRDLVRRLGPLIIDEARSCRS
jgi:2-furoyl-CoA dehydrogenase FAD binding subunit